MESVSVIIPVLNEEEHIEELVNALSKQDYPKEALEYIFVDGGSSDQSKELIRKCCEQHRLTFSVLDNPNRTAPYAFNIGMEYASGEIIVILSAHSIYHNDYISRCVGHLLESGADNVGGHVKVIGKGRVGKCIASLLSSRFGAGGADFRVSKETKYVDTVPFGTFRKSLVERIGGFNTELPRSEDNEFNYRIRKNGGKVLLVPDVEILYYCRESVSELIKMGVSNGRGVGFTAKKYPGVMSWKHFVPMLFVVSLMLLGALCFLPTTIFRWALLVELIAYISCDLYCSVTTKELMQDKLLLFILFPLFHISYGMGTLQAMIKMR